MIEYQSCVPLGPPVCSTVPVERSEVDQAVAVLTRSQRGVLVAVALEPSADAFAAALSLALALEGLGKTTTVVSPSHVPELLQFLPGTAQVSERIVPSAELRLEVPLGGQRPSHVEWEVLDDTLRITVQPERASPFPETEVNVTRGGYPWDLVITMGVPRLHALGTVFTDHARFFYDTPLLNIDRGTANEFFGTVNLVPATHGTVTEVVAELLDALGGVNLLTPEVSTGLLAGVIAGTDSFRSPTTSPNAFQTASQLIAQKADHAAVVRHLFHTHALPELRLLGRALARLQELAGGLLVSTLKQGDFAESGTTPDAVPAVFSELIEWSGERRPAALAFERRAGALEALVFLGRVSADDREAFRAATAGVSAGPFVLVNLGSALPSDAARIVAEQIVPRLPGAPES